MKNTIELLKRDLGFYTDFKALFSNKKTRNAFLMKIFASIILVFYTILFTTYILDSYDAFFKIGLEDSFLMMGFSSYLILLLVFIIPYIVSSIYLSNQVKILLRFPITKEEILITRIISLAIASLIYAVGFTIPVIIKYGISLNQSVLFYILALISILASSIMIISFISIIVIFIMKFINKYAGLKKILQYGATLLFFILIIGIQAIIQSQALENEANFITSSFDRTTTTVESIFLPLKLVRMGLTSENVFMSIIYIALFTLLSFVVLTVAIKISSKMMIDGVLSSNTVQKKKIKINDKTSSIIMEIFSKDVKNIFSHAVYFVNKVLFGVILPALIILYAYLGIKSESSSNNLDFNQIKEMYYEVFDQLINIFGKPELTLISISIFVTFILVLFVASGSETTSSTFSREGKNIWLMQTLPIKTNDQLLGRILASTFVILISSVPILIMIMFLMKFEILAIIAILITGLLVALSFSSISLIIGIIASKVDWDNANKAVKGMNSLFVLLIALAINFLIFFLPIKFNWISNETVLMIPIIYLIIFMILGLGAYLLNTKLYENKLNKFSK